MKHRPVRLWDVAGTGLERAGRRRCEADPGPRELDERRDAAKALAVTALFASAALDGSRAGRFFFETAGHPYGPRSVAASTTTRRRRGLLSAVVFCEFPLSDTPLR